MFSAILLNFTDLQPSSCLHHSSRVKQQRLFSSINDANHIIIIAGIYFGFRLRYTRAYCIYKCLWTRDRGALTKSQQMMDWDENIYKLCLFYVCVHICIP